VSQGEACHGFEGAGEAGEVHCILVGEALLGYEGKMKSIALRLEETDVSAIRLDEVDSGIEDFVQRLLQAIDLGQIDEQGTESQIPVVAFHACAEQIA
jgi:hypothetical protein